MSSPLPIDSVIPDLQRALAERDEAVLVAAPGAGKTTRVPLALLQAPWLGEQQILMLEPRRLAAKAAAQRMAQQLGEAVGERVGYRMRLESKVSARTRIVVVTEGVLTRMLQSDPSLDGIGLVIFDEFHERSVDADLGLALTLYGRELLRDQPPLKLLLMSATLDSDAVARLLDDAPVIDSEGRSYPVAVHYGRSVDRRDIGAAVAECVLNSLQQDRGSILAFLPGQAEIRAAHRELQARLQGEQGVIIAPLFGDLSLEQQQRAIAPAPDGQRKVVLATSIAESSLTIDGVSVVIDSGYSRVPQFDPPTAMIRLHTQRVSRASAEQRAGRAGRLAPGTAYRLWPQEQQARLQPFAEPEIRQTDLAPLALQLLHWGVTPEELRWLDPPATAPWQQALDLLHSLQACEQTGQQWRITEHGRAMAALPLHPRLAHMLLKSRQLDMSALACDVAALLSERDLLQGEGADIALRLELMRGERTADSRQRPLLQRLRQQASQFQQLLRRAGDSSGENAHNSGIERVGLLLALAYPDRVGRQRDSGGSGYRLANGRAAMLHGGDPLRNAEWLAVAQLGGTQQQSSDRIYLAAAIDPQWLQTELADMIAVRDVLEWQNEGRQLVAERQWCLGKLILRRDPLAEVDDELRQQAVLDWIRQRGLDALPWTDTLRQWQARVQCLRRCDLDERGDSDWPDLSDEWLRANLQQWLSPFVGTITHIRHIQQLDLSAALHSLLPWPLPQLLDELAPTHYSVPTGSRIRIDYSQQPPVLAVKLQEMFGQQQTPSIAGGRIALMLHLLSPAQRPLQVTQDLLSFWNNAYHDVKKDMKGRYPKHPWPDDPLTAPPKRGTKKARY